MFRLIRQIRQQLHCAHVTVRGIYGDEINHTPGGRRIQCMDCGALLDGPVSIAAQEIRQRYWE